MRPFNFTVFVKYKTNRFPARGSSVDVRNYMYATVCLRDRIFKGNFAREKAVNNEGRS